jgi:hypothetical protein
MQKVWMADHSPATRGSSAAAPVPYSFTWMGRRGTAAFVAKG